MKKPSKIHYDAEIALNRFGYGANRDQISEIAGDARAWLKNQIQPASYPDTPWTSNQAIKRLAVFKEHRNKEKKNNIAVDNKMSMMDEVNSASIRKDITKTATKLSIQTLHHAIRTTHSFQARLVDFFSNHFSVSENNINMRALAPTLEREAIAPYIGGYFAQMLTAVESHPAMIYYLNNEQSAGPNSRLASRKKNKGLNENLAREILELHTLGVNGGYTQEDVKELAKGITGWSIGSPRREENPGFIFRKGLHEPGSRTVLGKKYNQKDQFQGVKILEDLSVHPSTAQFLSKKLAMHFISDTPPKELVDAMTAAWIKSAGHLKTVLDVLIDHPQSWASKAEKFKTPRDFVVSACRACQRKSVPKPGSIATLLLLGQKPFTAGSPAGFGDTASDWNGAEALITRIEWAEHLSANVNLDPLKVAKNALGNRLSPKTETFIKRAESRNQGLALFLMSPEFQRR